MTHFQMMDTIGELQRKIRNARAAENSIFDDLFAKPEPDTTTYTVRYRDIACMSDILLDYIAEALHIIADILGESEAG